MTIRTGEFTSWQSSASTPKLSKYQSVSPNVKQILDHITATFKGTKNIGNYGLRQIRGGNAWSTHAYGAAQDVSFRGIPDWEQVKERVIRFLIENSARKVRNRRSHTFADLDHILGHSARRHMNRRWQAPQRSRRAERDHTCVVPSR